MLYELVTKQSIRKLSNVFDIKNCDIFLICNILGVCAIDKLLQFGVVPFHEYLDKKVKIPISKVPTQHLSHYWPPTSRDIYILANWSLVHMHLSLPSEQRTKFSEIHMPANQNSIALGNEYLIENRS